MPDESPVLFSSWAEAGAARTASVPVKKSANNKNRFISSPLFLFFPVTGFFVRRWVWMGVG
jgi:hypothetical protein